MKKSLQLWCLAVFLGGLCGVQELPAQTLTTTALSADAQIVANQDNYKAWDMPVQAIGPNHRTTFRNTKAGQRQIVEVGTGMNFWNGRQWSASDPSFVAMNGGFVAGRIQHQVQLASDLYGDNAVTVRTPEGIMLNSTPLAIALFDAVSGNFQVIATVTHCAPALVTSNQVVYENAFTGVCASVVYTISAGAFHQDVVITGQLNPADYGFPPETTQIQILTEFYGAPTPERIRRPIYVEQDPKVRAAMAKPDLVDEQLGFGQFVLTTGKSFIAPSADNPNGIEATVTKEYRTLAGRTYLFESIPYVAITDGLQKLPPCQPGTGSLNSAATKGYAGIPRLERKSPIGAEMLQARNSTGVKGVVIDYVANIGGTLSGTTVFKGDTTYLVSSAVTCNGAAVIEGGAVFKYKTNTSITVGSTMTCKTGIYRPAIFTAVDDNTVGDTMNGVTNSGYTGTISSAGYANPALATTYALTFSNFRFRYAQMAIQVTDLTSTSLTISHAQFIDCIRGIQISAGSGCGCGCGSSSTFNVNNCLMSGVQYPFTSVSSSVARNNYFYLYNSTIDRSTVFLSIQGYYAIYQYLYAYNSVFANIPTMSGGGYSPYYVNFGGSYNGFYNNGSTFGSLPYSVSTSPFQRVGAGGHYLTLNSASGFRNVGSASLPATLAADLKLRTTYPPLVTVNTTLNTDQVLVPQVQRDTDTPDLGYHYDPLDYVFGGVYVTNAAVMMSNGVAIATCGTNNSVYGLGFGKGSSLNSLGTPNKPNWIVLYNTVMEGVGTNGNWQPPTNSVTGELYGATPAPSIYTRFTSWSVLAQDAPQFYAPTNSGPISFQDSEFHNGKLITYRPTINLTNCLLERVYVNLASTDTNTPYIRNNLFLGGTFNFAPNVTNSFVKDNLFDQTVIPTNTSIYVTYNGGYNAFVTNYNRLLPTNGTDVILVSSPTYKTGPLGSYYQATNSGLVNVGHTNADQVALYHYTVITNLLTSVQIKETNSVVDIGYHYVAVNTNGVPIDSNGDSILDYLADANGNGLADSGETNWGVAVFLTQPVSQTVIQGSNATFNVSVTGVAPLHYQWYFNSALVANATNAALTLNNVQANCSGNYYIIVTNNFGSVTSSNAFLTVLLPPSITMQPANQITVQGNNATFSITAVGTAPLNYQWYFNSALIANATNSSMLVSNVQTNNAGNYFVTVGNVAGSATSSNAALMVMSWTVDSDYDGRSDAQETLDRTDPFDSGSVLPVRLALLPVRLHYCDTNSPTNTGGQLSGDATTIVGIPRWSTNAVLIVSTNPAVLGYRDVETNGNANINLRNGTISFWVKPDWSSADQGGVGPGNEARLIELGTKGSSNGWWGLIVNSTGTSIYFGTQTNVPSTLTTNLTAPISWVSNTWHQVVLSYSATNSSFCFDGQPVITNGLGVSYYPGLSARSMGFTIGGSAGGTNPVGGVFDMCETFNYVVGTASNLANASPQALLVNSTGTDFWVMFFKTYNEGADLELDISGPVAATGTVFFPGGSSKDFTVIPGEVRRIPIPSAAMIIHYDVVENQGIHIVASQPISVYGINFDFAASEAFTGYPTAMLGNNYCIMARGALLPDFPEFRSQFAIVATKDNTTVSITPSVTADLTGHPGTATYTKTLQQGDTYQINSANFTGDVTGTFVSSDKPIAVLAGADLARVPNAGYQAGNPLMEEQIPLSLWGRQSLAFPLAGRLNGDSYRVLAAINNTVVKVNGRPAATLNAGRSYDTIVNGPVEFEANNPIQVAQFANGAQFSGQPGDPFEMLLPPTGQYMNNYTVSTPTGFQLNYLTLIVEQSAISTTTVDGNPVSTAGFQPIGSSGYYGTQVSVADGPHSIASSKPVGIQVYGFSDYDGYGYIGGIANNSLAAVPDTCNVSLNGVITIDVLANDVFSSPATMTLSKVSDPAHGTAVVTVDNKITYTQNGSTGDDQFTYQISENGNISTAVVTIEVNNHLPIAVNVSVPKCSLDSVTINVLGNDSDPDGDPLSIVSIGTPNKGNVSLNPDNTITYTSKTITRTGSGIDSFPYTITDGRGGYSTAMVIITEEVLQVVGDYKDVFKDVPNIINVLNNDFSPIGGHLTIGGFTQGAQGTVAYSADHTKLIYTLTDLNYTGFDTFNYTVSDGTCSASATVTCNVTANNPVQPQNDYPNVYENPTVVDVLNNDTDLSGVPLTISGFTQGAHGSVAWSADHKTLIYTPGTALLSIVSPPSGSTFSLSSVNISGMACGSISLPNGNTHAALWNTISSEITDLDPIGAYAYSTAECINDNGTVVGRMQLSDGTYHAFKYAQGQLTDLHSQVAGAGFPNSVAWGINNNEQICGQTYATAVYANQAFFLNYDNSVSHFDPLGGHFIAAYGINNSGLVTGVASTSTEFHAFKWQLGDAGLTDLDAFFLEPNQWGIGVNAHGDIAGYTAFLYNQWAYVIHDNIFQDLSAGYVNSYAFALNSKGQVVGAWDSAATGYTDRALFWQDGLHYDLNNLLPAASGWVLNDAVAINENGLIVGNGAYQGQPRAFATPAPAPFSSDTFNYTVSDGTFSATATVSVNLNTDNPVQPQPDSQTVFKNMTTPFNVLANDIDKSGGILTISGFSQGAHGSVAFSTDHKTLVYTPTQDYTGSDTFNYMVSDGTCSATAKVHVQVIQIPVPPVVFNPSSSATLPATVSLSVPGYSGAVIKYSLDGVTWNPYSAPIPLNSVPTIMAYATKTGFLNSGLSAQEFGNSLAPVAVPDVFQVQQAQSAGEDNPLDVLANDTDNEQLALTIIPVTLVDGNISDNADVTMVDGALHYAPHVGFYGMDVFSYKIQNDDHQGVTSMAPVTVFVNQTGNNNPNAADQSATLGYDNNLHAYSLTTTFNLLANDSDPVNDALMVYSISQPTMGTALINGDGTITYNRDPSKFGADSFTYTITDGNGGYATASVTIDQVDSIGIGIPDEWQQDYFGYVGIDPDADPDGDGLPNLVEFKLGTNPHSYDNFLGLTGIASGSMQSGTVQIPLNIGASVKQAEGINLYVNGEPSGDAILNQAEDGKWWLLFDTTHLPNGQYSLAAAYAYKKPGFYEGAYKRVYGITKNVTINNPITFDRIPTAFNGTLSIWGKINTGASSCQILIYNENRESLLQTLTGFPDASGNFVVSWDFDGGTVDRPSYVVADFFLNANTPQAQAVPHGANDNPPPDSTQLYPQAAGSGDGGFVAAWGWHQGNSSYMSFRGDSFREATVDILGDWYSYDVPGYELAPPENVPIGNNFRLLGQATKNGLTNALARGNMKNFVWWGHGCDVSISSYPDENDPKGISISSGEVADILQNGPRVILLQGVPHVLTDNRHPYRLVILNCCSAYSQQWATAFGVPYTSPTTTDTVATYQAKNEFPRAFVAWKDDIEIPTGSGFWRGIGAFLLSLDNNAATAEYTSCMGAMFDHWMLNEPLDKCVGIFAGLSYNEFDFDIRNYGISGCKDLKRQPDN